MAERPLVHPSVEEACWSACAATGRVLHALQLIRQASTPQDMRSDLIARLPSMVNEAREACWQVELKTDVRAPAPNETEGEGT